MQFAYLTWINLMEWVIYTFAIILALPLSDIEYADGLTLRYVSFDTKSYVTPYRRYNIGVKYAVCYKNKA